MVQLKKFPIMVFVLLLFSACELMPQGNQVLKEEDPDNEEYIGACSMELFEIVEERGLVPVMVDLVMEDYEPRSELNEEEWEEQRMAIIDLQNKFLRILEENDLKIEAVKRGSRPWLAMNVDVEGLLFICKHELVETVTHDRADSPQ